MNKREVFELIGTGALAVGSVAASVLLVVLYIAAIGAGLGAFAGAAVWVFRAITGW